MLVLILILSLCQNAMAEDSVKLNNKDIDIQGNIRLKEKNEEDFITEEVDKLNETIESNQRKGKAFNQGARQIPKAVRSYKEYGKAKYRWNRNIDQLNQIVECTEKLGDENCQKILGINDEEDAMQMQEPAPATAGKRPRRRQQRVVIEEPLDMDLVSQYSSAPLRMETPDTYGDTIRKYVLDVHIKTIGSCYDYNDKPEKTLKTRLKISPDGTVYHLGIINPGAVKSRSVFRCITRKMAKWTFPRPPLHRIYPVELAILF